MASENIPDSLLFLTPHMQLLSASGPLCFSLISPPRVCTASKPPSDPSPLISYLQCCRVMVNVTQSLPSVKCCPSSPRHTANLSAQYSRSSLLLKVLTCLLPGPNTCSSIQLYSASRCFWTAPLTSLWHFPSLGSPFVFFPPFPPSFLSLPYFFTQHYGVHSASVGEKRC